MADNKSIIEKQKEQLQRYEKRLKDVVTAYKGLTKEKEALEASLKVLTTEKGGKGSNEKSAAEQKQLKALSESLAVISAEKSRMEANFQADKKKLLSEVDLLQTSVKSLMEAEQHLKYENESLKTKLTFEKQDRLQEQENLHVLIQQKQDHYEERVASLEAKLTELSVVVGEYDRHRNMDQKAIQRLKDQISELENRAQASVPNLDIEKQDKCKIKDDSEQTEDSAEIHASCREQYEAAMRELEHMKQMQTFQSLRGNRPDESNAEMEKLRSQNRNLQERVNNLTKKLNNSENEIHALRQSKKQIAEREREKYSTELSAIRKHQDGQITELEDQIRQLRERSLKILEEKDVEISKLRNALKNLSPTSVLAGELNQTVDTELLAEASGGDGAPPLFHFSQENARNTVEATMLRKQNFKLESEVRDLSRKLASMEVSRNDEFRCLQSEIERLSLGKSREGANLEYLKNVVLRYLTCVDDSSKRHMLSAICTVLRFSKEETRTVNRIYKK
ncbi:GRIP and coiled-coil domain-containing protein 1 [Neocloeon triangulifer]|uniref:GRIP and coiled-coil domain-containing protein 1 n=1 Tax=Neocloeon triangulifer TaxID=2078957 RepID=UPI00286F5227|nr:GRIP and coiled-coil domain-containing protein 1 [Neocloeon triangulifer]